jgi:RNA polymerase sigma-70 factor (ECF subfamily)
MAVADIDAVVERILKGDTDAFGEIIDLYDRQLWAIVAFSVRDRNRAEDVMQETYMAVYSSLDRYERGRDFGAWIRTIARNMCRRTLRSKLRDRNLLKNYTDEVAVRADLERVEDTDIEQRIRYLNECLNRLPQHSRRLMDLRYTRGRRVNEIAKEADRTAGTIKKMLFRIRVALKECIERLEKREAQHA